MDIYRLNLDLIDFSKASQFHWKARRVLIGLLLAFYYLMSIGIFAGIVFRPVQYVTTHIEESVKQEQEPAATALKEREGAFGGLITVDQQNQLALMASFGILGSLFFITWVFVRTTNRMDLPTVWYVTRPLQSLLMS